MIIVLEMVEHYYTREQASVFKPEKIVVNVLGKEFELYTSGGVFSSRKIDTGTELLIESALVKKEWNVLDLGCGYGVAGIALKKKNPEIKITFSDVNERAVKLTMMNIKSNKINADVFQSSVFENKELNAMRFDTIILNPPQTAGKKICFRMIEESAAHLVKGGLLQLVARHKKGGKELSKKMEEVFGNVGVAGKGRGYRVYVSGRL
jgi:16S rRNA G1207 methylase RsmC